MKNLSPMRRGQCDIPPSKIESPSSLGLDILNRHTPSKGPRDPAPTKIMEGEGHGKA